MECCWMIEVTFYDRKHDFLQRAFSYFYLSDLFLILCKSYVFSNEK
jgi:hypothetical protein